MKIEVKDKLEKIAKIKQTLSERERLLKERERIKDKKLQFKKSIEIGKLACKAKIDSLDQHTLLGAFLEISHRAQQAEHADKWKSHGAEFLNSYSPSDQALSISFQCEVDDDTKNKLKDLGFRWNKFRKEFYGYGNKHEMETIFQDIHPIVEVIE